MAGTATPTQTERPQARLQRSDRAEEWLAASDLQPISADSPIPPHDDAVGRLEGALAEQDRRRRVGRPARAPRQIDSASEEDEMTTSKRSQPAARRRGELHRANGDRQVARAMGARRRLNALPLRAGPGS
jgi:hypothetical protein